MRNRLDGATSPYLLQHADNPVHWHEWGDAAFTEAEARDVPVLLSVGYSACHWCHVMAHESFEDEATAAYMNEHFVNVKVDREERPDVDRIYMDSVQAMTGRGGWPMTVFLEPNGRPFYAGTYFPKNDMPGHPSFRRLLEHIVGLWQDHRHEVAEQAGRLTAAISGSIPASADTPDPALVVDSVARAVATWDQEHGGFGGAPKFPQAPTLEFLMRSVATDTAGEHRAAAVAAIAHSLRSMANGGIHDQLGGGFARYAVDRVWLVPHFEKMLYDNALLARLYLRAAQLTGEPDFTAVARRTLDYLIRDMTHPAGGLYSAEDADSEGVEGKFYTWPWDELAEVLGTDRRWAEWIYGATPGGNFEGVNILERYRTFDEVAELAASDMAEVMSAKERIDARLFAARAERIRPGLDDKVLTAWNGLALHAFAEAGAVLGEPRYIDHAIGIADFVLTHLQREDGRMMRSWRDGRVGVPGFCEDYAALAVGLFSLYQASGSTTWFTAAERLTRAMIDLFADPDGAGFFATGRDAEELITRPKNLMDNPTPSDNALAAEALQLLAGFTGESSLLALRDGAVKAATPIAARYPSAAGHLLGVVATGLGGVRQVAIVGPDRDDLEAVVWSQYRPDVILASAPEPSDTPPLLRDRTGGSGGALAYVCRGFVCDLPVDSPSALHDRLEGTSPGSPS